MRIVFLIFSFFIQSSALYSFEHKPEESILDKTMWLIVKILAPSDPSLKLTRKEFSETIDYRLKIAVTISTATILAILIKLIQKAFSNKKTPKKSDSIEIPNSVKKKESGPNSINVQLEGLSKEELYNFLYPINHISQQNIPHVNLLPDEVLLEFVALPMQQDELEDAPEYDDLISDENHLPIPKKDSSTKEKISLPNPCTTKPEFPTLNFHQEMSPDESDYLILDESSPNQPAPIKIGRPNKQPTSTESTDNKSTDCASKELEPSRLTKPKIPDPYLSKQYTSPNHTSHTRSSSANSTSTQASSNNTGSKKIPKSLSITSLSNQIPKKLSSSPENEKIKSRRNSILSTSDDNKKINKPSKNLNLKWPEFKSEKSQYPNYNENKSTAKINLSEAKNPIKNILSNDGLPEIPAQLKHKNLCRDPKCPQKATLHGNHFYSQRPLRLVKKAPIKIFYQTIVPIKTIVYSQIIDLKRIVFI